MMLAEEQMHECNNLPEKWKYQQRYKACTFKYKIMFSNTMTVEMVSIVRVNSAFVHKKSKCYDNFLQDYCMKRGYSLILLHCTI